MVPSLISTSYCSPVRLSVMERVSLAVATPPPFSLWVCSSAIRASLLDSAALRLPYPEDYAGKSPGSSVRDGESLAARADALGRRGLGFGVRAATWRARTVRARVIGRAPRLPVALLGLRGLGRPAGPPDEPEKRGHRQLQRQQHPDEHPSTTAHEPDATRA